MSRILLSAPFVGEIGWELMSWQARVRRVFQRGRYDRVLVLGGPGKAGFYDGMRREYRPVDLDRVPGAAYEDRRMLGGTAGTVPAETLRECLSEPVDRVRLPLLADGHTVDVLWPEFAGRPWPCDAGHQSFIRYERSSHDPVPARPWVVLVQRTRGFEASRNWPAENWSALADLLGERGVHTTVYPCEAEAAIAMLGGCDLAIGQSTGGLHLASLCGCPTMVWSVQRYLMWRWEITNRQRYETWWNPLGSPVIVHDVAQLPTPEQAVDQVMRALGSIGRRTGSACRRAIFHGKWRLRTALRRRVIEPGHYARWPWPVQRFVRYQLA